MNRPSLLMLVRVIYADPRLLDPQTKADTGARRLYRLVLQVFGWHSSACPPRHVHAALVAEMDDLPGLSEAARAAALEIVSGAFYPTDTNQGE